MGGFPVMYVVNGLPFTLLVKEGFQLWSIWGG